ncbi:flagellar biosynthesis anti-sigma factor FlgM [Ureibacillus sp. NPDC094379]
MKITSHGIHSVNPYTKQQNTIKPMSGKSTSVDKIEISSAAKEMQISSNYNTERTEKLQKLKEQIQTGEYKVDANKLAEDVLKYYRK